MLRVENSVTGDESRIYTLVDPVPGEYWLLGIARTVELVVLEIAKEFLALDARQ